VRLPRAPGASVRRIDLMPSGRRRSHDRAPDQAPVACPRDCRSASWLRPESGTSRRPLCAARLVGCPRASARSVALVVAHVHQQHALPEPRRGCHRSGIGARPHRGRGPLGRCRSGSLDRGTPDQGGTSGDLSGVRRRSRQSRPVHPEVLASTAAQRGRGHLRRSKSVQSSRCSCEVATCSTGGRCCRPPDRVGAGDGSWGR